MPAGNTRSIRDLIDNFPSAQLAKGRVRFLLVAIAKMIEEEAEPGPHKELKNPIELGIYKFLKKCGDGDLECLKVLFDRLDGKAPQALEVGDPNGNPVPYQIIRFADMPIAGEHSDAGPKRLDS